jgi:hypothetical protein
MQPFLINYSLLKNIILFSSLGLFLNSCFKEDNITPVITLKGDNTFTVIIGNEYIDPGFTAKDNKDGDITYLVKVTDYPNTDLSGVYYTKYNVSDASGNHAKEIIRTVFVSHNNISLSNIYSANGSCDFSYVNNENYFISVEKDESDSKTLYFKGFNNLSQENRIKAVIINNTGEILNIPSQTIQDTVYSGNGRVNNTGTEIMIDIIRESNAYKDSCNTTLVRDLR